MPRNGSGQYSLPSGNPVVTNTVISSSGWANPTMSDIAAAITDSIAADGQTVPSANLPMGNFRHTGVANAQSRTDYAAAGQIQDGGLTTLGSVSGTDTITASSVPATTVYTAGQAFDFIAAGANTTNAVTLNINGLGAKNVTKLGAVVLSPGDLQTGESVRVRYDGTQFQVISPLNSNQSNSFRNKLINGNFDVWQRGTSFTSTGSAVYTADRWTMLSGTGGGASAAIAQAAVTPGGEPAGAAPIKFALNIIQTVAAGATAPALTQKIESVKTLQGQLVTLSFWGYVASGTLAILPSVSQFFGTGGSPSASVNVAFPSVALTTTPQKFTVQVMVPSIGGKTLGTNGDDALWLNLGFPAVATYNAVIEQVQLEQGNASPFESRPYEMELALCKRYFNTMPALALTTAQVYSQSLDVQMRATPALTISLNSGSGATYAMLTNTFTSQVSQAFFQNGANSAFGTASIKFDADL